MKTFQNFIILIVVLAVSTTIFFSCEATSTPEPPKKKMVYIPDKKGWTYENGINHMLYLERKRVRDSINVAKFNKARGDIPVEEFILSINH